METLVKSTPNLIEYILCGEILKSKKEFKDQYILRCIECKEIYLLLESFIYHLSDSCRNNYKAAKIKREEHLESSSDEVDVINEPLECEESSVKIENTNLQVGDPLIVVKQEPDIEIPFVKIEPINFEEETENSKPSKSLYDTKPSHHQDEDDCVEDVEGNGSFSESQDESEYQATDTEEGKVKQKSTNTNGVSSSFVSSFMKSEESLTVLIAAFRDQPQLWNKSMPRFGNKPKKREYMTKIAEELNMNHNIIINESQVTAIIAHLYRKYHDHLMKAQEKDEYKRYQYVKPWYLTKLSFIEPYLGSYSLEILDSTHPLLSPEQIVKILKIYQSLPHLWNSNLIENHCKNKRHESIIEMLNKLETTMNLKINENLLEQYLRTIHNNFCREKRRILNLKKLNKAGNIEQSGRNYYKHLKFLYDHVPPLRCNVCGADSISPLHFKMHTSAHDGTLPFTCSQCNKQFKSVNVYTSHAKRHFEDLNYICKECNKKFVNYSNLRLHMRIHTGDKPYCCELCGDSFRFLQTLSNHRRRHEKRYLHTCKICSQGFYSKMRHDDHMNSHNNIRSHVCEICNKAFITKRALKRHKGVHEDARNYACGLCSKTFKQKTGVNQHMKTHDIATTE